MKGRQFYLSAAPQCPIPDLEWSDGIKNAVFDYVWVQFYNSPACSANVYVPDVDNGFNFADWVQAIKNSVNPTVQLFIGLVASPAVTPNYVTPGTVYSMVAEYNAKFSCKFWRCDDLGRRSIGEQRAWEWRLR
jgi:chitinase